MLLKSTLAIALLSTSVSAVAEPNPGFLYDLWQGWSKPWAPATTSRATSTTIKATSTTSTRAASTLASTTAGRITSSVTSAAPTSSSAPATTMPTSFSTSIRTSSSLSASSSSVTSTATSTSSSASSTVVTSSLAFSSGIATSIRSSTISTTSTSLTSSVSTTTTTSATSSTSAAVIPISSSVPITNCVVPGTFAMSFDDGPYSFGADITATLQKYNSKGSFYVNGDNWGCIYDRADDLIARYKAGHMIGSHTWSHPDIALLTDAELNDEITKVETALMKILGVKPRFFRPPFGSYSDASLKVLESRGYYTTLWTHDSEDTLGTTPAQSVAGFRALYADFPAPVMSLSHEVKQGTSTIVVPTVVPELIKAGYKLVTVAECLAVSPYQVIGTPSARDATWTCDAAPAASGTIPEILVPTAVVPTVLSTAAAVTNCVVPGTFAMSFDDGPYSFGADIATYLTSYNSKGSFYVNGYNWGCIYDRADDLIARYKAGHMIGSHTWSHVDITTLTPAQLNKQLDLVETALKKILGVVPRFFRPPYGEYNAASLAVLAARGYYTTLWSLDGGDTLGLTPAESIARYKAVYDSYPAPVMALNHEIKEGTSTTVVPAVVPELLTRGYKLVTVAECLGLSPYQSIGSPSARDATWTCDGTPPPGAA